MPRARAARPSIERTRKKAPSDFRRPRHCILDELQRQAGLTVSKQVPYHDAIRDGVLFLREKMTVRNGHRDPGASPALQYSAFFSVATDDDGPCEMMLGWDHAMILVRREAGWFAHSVYSAKYNPVSCTDEAKVWGVAHRGPREALTNGTRMIIPGPRGEGERTWYQFDLSGDDIQVEHVVTLGLTSCSFACLFNDRYIVISHMSSKTIPVAWLASTVLGLTAETPLKLLVSHHGDPTEFDKYTTVQGMPLADTLSIDSILCSRGVKHLPPDLGTFTPSLSHPYMGLNLTAPDDVSCFCVLGYNNDPALHIEKPPLHIVWPLFFQTLAQTKDAQLVIDILGDCHQGKYGFDELYREMFAELVAEHSLYKIEHGRDFTSPLIQQFLRDLKPTSSWSLFSGTTVVPAKAVLPDPLNGWALIVFLMVDVVQHLNGNDAQYARFTAALLRAWNNYQKGFNFDLSRFDDFAVPAPKDRDLPKYTRYLG